MWDLKKIEVARPLELGQRGVRVMSVAAELRALQMRIAALLLGGRAPARSAASAMMPSGTLKELATLVVGTREAIALSGGAPRGWLVVSGSQALVRLLRAVVDSLAAYAVHLGVTLAEVGEQLRSEGVRPYLAFVTDLGGALLNLDEEEERGEVELFRVRLACSPQPLWIEDESGRVNPAFLALMRRALETGMDDVRIARLPLERRQSAGLPIALFLQIFSPERGEMVEFIDEMLPTSHFHCSPPEQDVLAALAAAMPRLLRPAAPPPEEETGEAQPIVLGEETPEAVLRARKLLETFALPETHLMQVLYVMRSL
jgi:PAS domain-containing protein